MPRLTTGYQFFGTATNDYNSSKKFWSIYSQAVEYRLSDLTDTGLSLKELLDEASRARQKLALRRNESTGKYTLFGLPRVSDSMKDCYSDNATSIIDSNLFPVITKLMAKQLVITKNTNTYVN